MKKPIWIVTAQKTNSYVTGIEAAEFHFRPSAEVDAARLAASYPTQEKELIEYYSAKAKTLLEQTGNTLLYDEQLSGITLKAQRNTNTADCNWYGLHIIDARVTKLHLNALQKLINVDNPLDAITILKARWAGYCSGAGYIKGEKPEWV
jgi:hypothetical protein